jgi:hypothetical protein
LAVGDGVDDDRRRHSRPWRWGEEERDAHDDEHPTYPCVDEALFSFGDSSCGHSRPAYLGIEGITNRQTLMKGLVMRQAFGCVLER